MKKVKILLASALVVTSVFSIGIQKAYADTVNTNLNTAEEAAADSVSGSISLHGNSSTGYEWRYKVKDTFIAEVSEQEEIPDDPTGTACGAGQTQVWEVKGLMPGTTEVTFNYLRPWEAEVLQSKTYVINVDSDLNVTVSEKAAANPVEGNIVLRDKGAADYQWKYAMYNENIAKIEKDKSLPYNETEPDRWTVSGLKNGSTEVTFYYINSSEGKILDSKTYIITVDSDLNVTVTEKAVEGPENAMISLHGNASTGYQWKDEIKDTSIAELTEENPVRDADSDGSGETNIWTVKGLKEGTTEVTFNYSRPWLTEIDKTVTYVINVDSDLNVTVSEKAADPAKGSIALQSDDYKGYWWQYGIEDESIARLTEGAVASDDSLQHLDGSLETHTWEVKGLKEGTTEVTFNYLERWMNKIDKTVTYVINVDSDLNVTVKEKTAPANGTISLEGNDSTGYVWQYAIKDESIAKLIKDRYQSSIPPEEEPAPGCSQIDIWAVKGLKEGTTEVTFNYLRPWETEIDTTITYVIKVDSDLNVTVSEKAAEDPVKPVIKNLKVEESDSEVSNQINPTISFENAGEEQLDLTKMKFKYYYTADGEQDETFNCYYAGTTNGAYKTFTSNVEGKIVKLTGKDAKENADRCLEVTFNGGVLDAGQGMTMQLCVHKDNWASYYRANDYSYKNQGNVHVTVEK